MLEISTQNSPTRSPGIQFRFAKGMEVLKQLYNIIFFHSPLIDAPLPVYFHPHFMDLRAIMLSLALHPTDQAIPLNKPLTRIVYLIRGDCYAVPDSKKNKGGKNHTNRSDWSD